MGHYAQDSSDGTVGKLEELEEVKDQSSSEQESLEYIRMMKVLVKEKVAKFFEGRGSKRKLWMQKAQMVVWKHENQNLSQSCLCRSTNKLNSLSW